MHALEHEFTFDFNAVFGLLWDNLTVIRVVTFDNFGNQIKVINETRVARFIEPYLKGSLAIVECNIDLLALAHEPL